MTADLSIRTHSPGDRKYAIGAGNANVDDGIWLKKAFFLQLMSYELLAGIDCEFDMDQNREMIILSRNGKKFLKANMQSDAGRKAIAIFFDDLLDAQLHGSAKMVHLNDGAFTDSQEALISLGGSASLASFGNLTLVKPDPRRFRLNIIFETSKPFEEEELIGKRIAVGDVRLDVTDSVVRCAAINVDPETAERGPDYLTTME